MVGDTYVSDNGSEVYMDKQFPPERKFFAGMKLQMVNVHRILNTRTER